MNSELRQLYQEVIIDHGRHPRHFKVMQDATHVLNGDNPLCGDKLTLYIKCNKEVIEDISFQGSGCAISTASSSLMIESLKGKTISEAQSFFNDFHKMITQKADPTTQLGKLAVLAGVCEFPSRVKCATLAWHTLMASLDGKTQSVSTE